MTESEFGVKLLHQLERQATALEAIAKHLTAAPKAVTLAPARHYDQGSDSEVSNGEVTVPLRRPRAARLK